jgi:zinc protease
LLQLSWLYMTAPRADSSAFASVRDRLSALIANRDASPEAAFGDTVQLTLAQHHPRERPLTVQRLSEWDLERSIDFYRARFSEGSDDWTFVFVGAFDMNTLRPLVERWIGGLPADKGIETWRDTGVRPPTGVVEKTVRKGIEPRAQTLLVFSGPAEYKPEERHRIASLADVLDIRLREVLREDLGGTYGAGVSGSISRSPEQRFTFQIGFGAEPARLEELVSATFEEIARLQTEGPDSATLAKVKETQRREWQTSLRENGFWLGQLARAARDDSDPRGLLGFPARVDALTVEMIKEAATVYLSRERYVRVSLLPAEGS